MFSTPLLWGQFNHLDMKGDNLWFILIRKLILHTNLDLTCFSLSTAHQTRIAAPKPAVTCFASGFTAYCDSGRPLKKNCSPGVYCCGGGSQANCDEIIANHDIQGAHDKNKEFIGNGCHNFTKFIVRENLPGVYDN